MELNIKKRLNHPMNININIPRDIGKMVVSWDSMINPDALIISDNKIENIKYNVYRGNSINGIYYRLNKELIDTNIYIDDTISLNANERYWYKVTSVAIYTDGTEVESFFSEPRMYEIRNQNKWFRKINERNMWILKNDGVLMDLYIRKNDGEKCPECWDEYRGQSINTSCKICFGTGIVGGYEPTYQLYVRQKPAAQQIDLDNKGYMLNSNPGSWTISSIKIKNRDLLINPEGKMFSVTSVNINHANGYYFHQEIQMKELDPYDERYNIKRKILYPEF